MFRRKEMMSSPTGKPAQNQCRLCLSNASECCSLANRLEDMRTVQEVIKMLLSIEDDPGLPQQICASCSKELLHMARLKDCWVANQFTLARQASKLVPKDGEDSEWTNMVQFQADEQAEEEMYLEVDENVSDSELFFANAELGEFSVEVPGDRTKQTETNNDTKKVERNKYVKKCGEYKFRCHKCRLSFPTLKLKNEHLKLHNKCEVCGATFMAKNDLRRHMRIHNGERPHGCPHCYQRFSRMSHLKDHIKKHDNLQSHACLLCTKNFPALQELLQHKMEAHSNTRRTQRQKATKVERLPFEGGSSGGTIRQPTGGDVRRSVVVKEELVDEDYELIID
ncbi:zinc finger protein 37A-like [Culex pipiens pallens]|uniref:zinc finger protein 37A-like n=1 Tax=Culex pipiens pallens TaxID=42434 RepID=UPI001952A48B|nr:zinc finger protein 37A-like [Culex pipiens pallens]XP_052562381.1 zinc finger protein 37A-like [Culex pipiens pallens]